MAISLSLDLARIPGASTLLAKLDSYKASFLSVPANVNAALDKLALVRAAMTRNNAPPSALADAQTVDAHLRQVQTEWNVAAATYQQIDSARQSGHVSLDLITSAGTLVASVGYVLANQRTLMSSVDSLAAKYLTAAQRQQLAVAGLGSGGLSFTTYALLGALAYLVVSRRRG